MPPEPRVLVIGAGSIGARHCRCLAAAGATVHLMDPDADRAAAVAEGKAVPFAIDRLDGYDGIVVASPTRFHFEQAEAALATGAHVLVEKPLGMRSADVRGLLERGDAERLMVGYNLRFHAPVRRFVELVQSGRGGRMSAVRAWFGSWLPDWRPAVDYRRTYSARSDLGGGVLLDVIHELDILVWLLGGGPFQVAGAIVDRLGPLEIDVEDTVKALLWAPGRVAVELSLDYLSRRYRRGIEVIGDEATLRLDWARSVIEVEDASGVESEVADVPVAESYRLQAECFLAFLRGEGTPPVTAETSVVLLGLTEAIREKAR